MTSKKKWLNIFGLILLTALLVIQFFHTKKNLSNDFTNDISKTYIVPDSIQQILKTSCDDCHSNSTVYPWYSKIQPVDWWLQNHVNEGKRELNFSEFSSYRIYRQYKKLKEIIDELKDDEMPLTSYLLIHGNAKLNDSQKLQLTTWAESLRETIKANYPADSLVNPNKREKK